MAKNFFSIAQVKSTPGSVVRAFRTNFDLTLKDLQTITGIDETNISAMENDKREIGLKSAILLSAVFGIDPEQILFPEGYERKALLAKIRQVVKNTKRIIGKKKPANISSRNHDKLSA
jgi:plasmid maintenance system antidote protein VapI